MSIEIKPLQSSNSKKIDPKCGEKEKALSLVVGQIERNFGKGSIMRLGDASKMRVGTISTGALTLDLALGGGVPKRTCSRDLWSRKFWKNNAYITRNSRNST